LLATLPAWGWILLAVAAVSLIAVLLVQRARRRRRQQELEAELEPLQEPPEPSEQDLAALEVIQRHRRRNLLRLSRRAPLGLRSITRLLGDLIGEIARIYHPGSPYPELAISLGDLIRLLRRSMERLESAIETAPGRPIAGLRLDSLADYYRFTTGLLEKPVVRQLRDYPAIRTLIRRGWWLGNTIRSYASVSLWAFRGARIVAREAAVRKVTDQLIRIVGEEAMAAYGGRLPPSGDSRSREWILRETLHVAGLAAPLHAATIQKLLELILEARGLTAAQRLRLARILSRGKMPPAEILEDLLRSPEFCRDLMRRLDQAATLQPGGEARKLARLEHWEQRARCPSRARERLLTELRKLEIRPDEATARRREIVKAGLLVQAAALQIDTPGRFTPQRYDELLGLGAQAPPPPLDRSQMEELFSRSEDPQEVLAALERIHAPEDRDALIQRLLELLTEPLPFTRREQEWLESLLDRAGWRAEAERALARWIEERFPFIDTDQRDEVRFLLFLLSEAEPEERFLFGAPTTVEETLSEAGEQFTGRRWLILSDRRLLLTGFGRARSGALRFFALEPVPEGARFVLTRRHRLLPGKHYQLLDAENRCILRFKTPRRARKQMSELIRRWHARASSPAETTGTPQT
jgi:hypothetical protein